MAPTKPFGTLPSGAKGKIEPFEINIPEQKIIDLKQLLKLSPIAKPCYENQQTEKHFGVTRDWIVKAKTYWENEFDWREHEAYLNTFPQFKAEIIDDDGTPHSIHFAALFSEKKDAIPLTRQHGWPCTFAEFFPVLSLLREKYSPKDLPYHVIVPTNPGWTFSSSTPVEKNWTMADTARILHKLMLQIGFDNGYVVQGGDIGAAVSRLMAVTYPEVKAIHLNHCHMSVTPETRKELEPKLSVADKKGLDKYAGFFETGNAYGRMHGTRPATVGLVLSSSPIALLSWVGEKYLEWCDSRAPFDLPTILREVSLFWLTETSGTSIYSYREDYVGGIDRVGYFHGLPELYLKKPFGYSYFPEEIAPIPKAWVERTGDLVWSKYHETGGHYPALEKPEELLEDIEGFLGKVWR